MDIQIYNMYTKMLNVFTKNMAEDTDIYDVDMFTKDIWNSCFTATDPQDIDEDDFVVYQAALIMLIRDDLLLQHFGFEGLAVIHAELMHCGEQYFINKALAKEV